MHPIFVSCHSSFGYGTCRCYATAGLTCEEQNNNNNNNNGQNQLEFNLQDAVQCGEVKGYDKDSLTYYLYQGGNNQYYNYNGNNNKNEMKLSMGPYCSSDGNSIFMGLFLDETCSVAAPAGLYEKLSYGTAMPYSTTSLVEHNCMSCAEPADNNNKNDGDEMDADSLLEVCENVYIESGKCETGLADGVTYYKNEAGCSYIATLHAPGKKKSSGAGVSASKVFSGLFAVTTVVFGGVAYHLYQKVRRQKVNLGETDGTMA